MIESKLTYEDRSQRVERAADKAAFENFQHAAASIRKDWAKSIRRSKKQGPPGKPPRTKRGAARRALRFWSDEFGAIVGPRASIIGDSMSAHEFGGVYKGQRFKKRPSGLPALERAAPRLPVFWRNSIGDAHA